VIACEVSVTNTVDYEVANIEKCLNAGSISRLRLRNRRQIAERIKKPSADQMLIARRACFECAEFPPGFLEMGDGLIRH